MPRTIATISAIEQFIDETQTIQRTTVTAQFSPSLDPLHHPLLMMRLLMMTRPHRHQAWDDQGLGIRRSGVLPSHSRANGGVPPPLYRA